MKRKLKKEVIDNIMQKGVELNKETRETLVDFKIMESELLPETLILRYTSINIDNIDNPVQCYHYQCFNLQGKQGSCLTPFENQDKANAFFWSLKCLYEQEFAMDHK